MSDRPTIVFADDSLQMAEIACGLLSSSYDILGVALNGSQAIRCICRLQPDYAILDIGMPEIDGITIARRLQQTHSSTRLIFCTVIDDDDYIREARSLGHGYVLKRRMYQDLLGALTCARDGKFFSSR